MFPLRILTAGGLLLLTIRTDPVPSNHPVAPAAVREQSGDAIQLAQRDVALEAIRPTWQVGDRWIVETVTAAVAERGGGTSEEGVTLRWEFTVAGIEPLEGHPCFRVDVRCLQPASGDLQSVFWADRESLVLRQVQTRLRVAGQYRTLSESYQFPDGRPSAVQTAFSVVPLDLPVFEREPVKGARTGTYEALPGPAGPKTPDQVGFLIQIEQQMAPANAAQVKEMLHPEFAKSLTEETDLAEVRLRSLQGEVRQLWRAGCPWPLRAENATTVARLVESADRTSLEHHPAEVER
ncbi:MAG: hypothetical protein FJ276_19675 [Planctomycetes bacterium]|nr:hypothetical protein [Planctomycetota bacterium]